MSNDHSNKDQNELAELSSEQQNPGLAKASDFIVNNAGASMDSVPGHGQRGKNAAELKKLENENNPGFSPRRPIPTRNSI